MRARFVLVLVCVALAVALLPVGGCGDNDNSAPPLPCCPVCGDGVCGGDEGTCDCRQDCIGGGVICPGPRTCGNGLCDRAATPGESHERCPEDCPLDCRICEGNLRVYVNGGSTRGAACPAGTTVAYRDGDILACHSCTDDADCDEGAECSFHCGPGCENDTGGCCGVRGCIEVVP